MKSFTLIVPIPPSVNHCYVTTHAGRRILTDAARGYRDGVALQVVHQCQLRFAPKAKLCFTVRFYFERNNRDIDNALKVLQDAVTDGLGINDKQIIELHAYKSVDKWNPRCEVHIEELA